MAEVWFYHLERRSVADELPGLLQRGLERDLRMAVQGTDAALMRDLSDKIWAHEDVAFLPHGFNDEDDAATQPIVLLTKGQPRNEARFLFCVDGAEPAAADGFDRVTILFDGTSEAQVAQARTLWKRFKSEGLAIRYWKQDEDGRWKDQAA